jgi:hypothetical protein
MGMAGLVMSGYLSSQAIRDHLFHPAKLTKDKIDMETVDL